MEQRLPESPPAVDPAERTLMDIFRTRTRSAMEALFLPVCRILNAECNYVHVGLCAAVSPDAVNGRRAPVSLSKSCTPQPPMSPPPDQVVPTPDPANSQCHCGSEIWTEGGVSPENMLRTASELASVIATFLSRTVDKQSGLVNYSGILGSPDFVSYLKTARKLRYFDPTLLSPTQRKAFFLNIYNALLIHAIAGVKKPKNKFDRMQLYNSAAYSIGGRSYTLNDIEHGVLRCNRPGVGRLKQRQFEVNDARLLCALPEPMDARIHFALNCGAKSCPPVRYYDPEDVSPALDNATKAFLLGVEIDGENNTVTLSKLFQWYRSDFIPERSRGGENEQEGNRELLTWILKYITDDAKIMTLKQMIASLDARAGLNNEKQQDIYKEEQKNIFSSPTTIKYGQYDWSVNDSSL